MNVHRRVRFGSKGRPVMTAAIAALLAVTTLTASFTASASALTGPSPGTFSGKGFDACTAPAQDVMDSWLGSSAYQAVGIYMGGVNRGCAQPLLTAQWVGAQQAAGWHLIPIYMGLQPYCTTSTKPYRFTAADAATSGRTAADDAVVQARALGLATGSTIYSDIEAYSTTDSACSTAVLTYQSQWTQRLHALGFFSGFYSSLGSGVRDQVAAYYSTAYVRPDYLWFARYDGIATASDPAIPDTYWLHRRIKQYRGGALETYGGKTLNVDRDQLDITSVPGAFPHTRLAGADRYGTAVAISQSAFQPQSPGSAVTVASGANFPDALAAGPVAVAQGGPLLLVPQDGALPLTDSDELRRLNPSRVDIAGGTAAVSSVVQSELQGFARPGTVFRWAGQNRYETAAKLAGLTGGLGKTVFIATGASFPDALGGSADAGRLGGALMLTDRYALPQATATALSSGKPTKVVILGGVAVIDPAVLVQIKALLIPGATMERWAGADRYATAAAISLKTYPQGATTAYLASGASYPDALAGAPVAAHAGAPLLLTSRDCIPASTFAELTRLGATNIVVLGGTAAVSDAAANLTGCSG
jgi:putative cell wall-binding protein